MTIKKGTTANDIINGTSANDALFGVVGDDTLNGLGGNDFLYGGLGDDTLDGGTGNDRLWGGLGADHLSGGDGNDHLFSSSGFLSDNQDTDVDILDGGAGDDFVAVLQGDIAVGGNGYDTLGFNSFSALPGDINLDFTNIDSATGVTFAAAGTLFEGTLASQFERVDVSLTWDHSGGSVAGSKGGDYISFDLTNDTIGAKGISISGGLGSDELYGSWKSDILRGGAGDDLIAGGSGADKMTGGTGSDLFAVYSSNINGNKPDTITDFSAAEDFYALIANDVVFDSLKNSYHLDFGSETSLLKKGVGPQSSTTAAGIAQFLYETDTGNLSLDANGSAAGGVILLCTLTNKANITANNLIVDYDFWA